METATGVKVFLDENSTDSNNQSTHLQCNNPTKCTCSYESKPSQISNAVKCAKAKIFFKDGIRSVDYILVWDALNENAVKPESHTKRHIFENNLVKEGLELERELQEENGLRFIKVKNIYKLSKTSLY